MNTEQTWEYIIDLNIATEEELSLITSINGYSVETLGSVIYCRTGYRSVEQLQEMED